MPLVKMDRADIVDIRNALSAALRHFESHQMGPMGKVEFEIKLARCFQQIENITYRVADGSESTRNRCARIAFPTRPDKNF